MANGIGVRGRRLRGAALREYEAFWAGWHAKYDRYKTSNGHHKLNSIGNGAAVCTCGARYYNAPEADLLRAFEGHLQDHEPVAIDVGASVGTETDGADR